MHAVFVKGQHREYFHPRPHHRGRRHPALLLVPGSGRLPFPGGRPYRTSHIVDRSIEPAHGHIVVAVLNNEPICKRLCKRGKEIILLSENPKYPARYILEGDELSIWGVITSTVRSHV